MTRTHKLMLGAAAVLVAGAASFPRQIAGAYFSGYPADIGKRSALALCERTSPTFIRFLPSDRAACYARMRNAAPTI